MKQGGRRRRVDDEALARWLGRRAPRGVLLDVDGTLYHKGALRLAMAGELSGLFFRNRSAQLAWDAWDQISCYRAVLEELRSLGHHDESLRRLQYTEAARRSGADRAALERLIREWMVERPLRYMRWCRRGALEGFLAHITRRGIRAGLFSDYPLREKAEALGVLRYVSVALCATDDDINALKPHPRGFLAACAGWQLPPGEVLYVGDRPETDGAGATAAGMKCVILAGKGRAEIVQHEWGEYVRLASFGALRRALAALP